MYYGIYKKHPQLHLLLERVTVPCIDTRSISMIRNKAFNMEKCARGLGNWYYTKINWDYMITYAGKVHNYPLDVLSDGFFGLSWCVPSAGYVSMPYDSVAPDIIRYESAELSIPPIAIHSQDREIIRCAGLENWVTATGYLPINSVMSLPSFTTLKEIELTPFSIYPCVL